MKKAMVLFLSLLFSTGLLADMQQDLAAVQKDWAIAKYRTPEPRQEKAFAALTARARKLVDTYPDRAEPRIWLAIVLSTDAGISGGLSALGKVKAAKSLLEAAEKIDPNALDGSIYTSLGSLYYQVPGWPLAFGNDQKAETYLRKALAINPDGIDPNYFYGDFLLDQEQPAKAMKYLLHAKAAPPRPGRPIADEGRRQEIEQDLAKARKMME